MDLKFLKVPIMSFVINIGEIGDRFYIILKGAASVQVPNSKIANRDDKLKELQKLQIWKSKEFDPKEMKAKAKFQQNYMVEKFDQIKIVKDEDDPETKRDN